MLYILTRAWADDVTHCAHHLNAFNALSISPSLAPSCALSPLTMNGAMWMAPSLLPSLIKFLSHCLHCSSLLWLRAWASEWRVETWDIWGNFDNHHTHTTLALSLAHTHKRTQRLTLLPNALLSRLESTTCVWWFRAEAKEEMDFRWLCNTVGRNSRHKFPRQQALVQSSSARRSLMRHRALVHHVTPWRVFRWIGLVTAHVSPTTGRPQCASAAVATTLLCGGHVRVSRTRGQQRATSHVKRTAIRRPALSIPEAPILRRPPSRVSIPPLPPPVRPCVLPCVGRWRSARDAFFGPVKCVRLWLRMRIFFHPLVKGKCRWVGFDRDKEKGFNFLFFLMRRKSSDYLTARNNLCICYQLNSRKRVEAILSELFALCGFLR